ncbi:hypothetical protein NBRC3284_1194 [Acetobacter pasteurianus NBRC 3284]|nr:sensor histidine kinase [Acetobacter pasteurianus]GCD72038.1 hypothetical protein NBRC3284_1194 [Acetobacter pasteurianus NBRC 3284]
MHISGRGEGPANRVAASLLSGLGRIFSTTSARMRLLICLSAVPVIAIGAVLALHNYREVTLGSAQRAGNAIMRLDLQFRHDTDRLRSALETIGHMDLTPDQIVHALRLMETISGQRYCFLSVLDDEGKPIQAWLLMHNGQLLPVCSDCGWQSPPPSIVHELKNALENSERSIITLPTGLGGYALGAIAGGADILVSTQRTSMESDALHTMILQIVGLVLLLVIGLVAVTLAANIVLIGPLRRLTYSVQKWQMEGIFDARITRSMPLELQRLGQAFTRATRRLSRHEARLKKAMAHQQLLMKEVHHRVKNNLQIVASLLNLQANQIEHPEVRAEFALARDRIRALATLHRTLYAEDALNSLNMAVFLQELCEQTLHIAGESEFGRMTLDVVSDSFWMDPDQAVPLALIVTEIITNSIKYAFPDGQKGTIFVRLHRSHGQLTLQVGDNGVGCAWEDPPVHQGIGLKLIHAFARQLKATLTYKGEGGVQYTLVMRLPETPPEPRK